MPTEKRRLQISLSDQLADTLDHLAALQGVSRASIVSDVMEEAQPTLQRVATALETVRKLPAEALGEFHRSLDAASGDMEALLFKSNQMQIGLLGQEAIAQFAPGTTAGGPLGRRAGGTGAKRSSAARSKDPRPVTRGSTTPTPTPSRRRR